MQFPFRSSHPIRFSSTFYLKNLALSHAEFVRYISERTPPQSNASKQASKQASTRAESVSGMTVFDILVKKIGKKKKGKLSSYMGVAFIS